MPDEKKTTVGVSQLGFPVVTDPMPGVRGERDLISGDIKVPPDLGKFIEVNKVPDLDGPEKLGNEPVISDKVINEPFTGVPAGMGAPVQKEERPETSDNDQNVIPFRVKAKGDPTYPEVDEARIKIREEDREELEEAA